MKLPKYCQDLLSTKIDLESVNNTEEISVYQWDKTSEMLTGPQCKEKITVQLADVKQHHFLKRNKHAVFCKQNKNLKENEILINVENYDSQQQHATQSAYFGYDSYTLYTACVYFSDISRVCNQM